MPVLNLPLVTKLGRRQVSLNFCPKSWCKMGVLRNTLPKNLSKASYLTHVLLFFVSRNLGVAFKVTFWQVLLTSWSRGSVYLHFKPRTFCQRYYAACLYLSCCKCECKHVPSGAIAKYETKILAQKVNNSSAVLLRQKTGWHRNIFLNSAVCYKSKEAIGLFACICINKPKRALHVA